MAARLDGKIRVRPPGTDRGGRRNGPVAAGSRPTALQSLGLRAADEASRLHTLSAMGSGRYGFALCGWVPVSLKPRVTEILGSSRRPGTLHF